MDTRMPGSTQSWFLILVRLLVAAVSTAAQYRDCSLNDIHGRVQPVSPVALIGSTVTLNCTIHPDEDGITAHEVFWRKGTTLIPPENYHALSDTVSQLVLQNVSQTSPGHYVCFVTEPIRQDCPVIGGVELNVGYAPEELVLDRCLSENLDSFTCWWSRGRETLIDTEYSITYTHLSRPGLEACEPLEVEGSSVVCHFVSSISHAGNILFHLNVTATNKLGRAESNNSVNPENYVKPNPVRNLRVVDRRSTSVSLSWDNPAELHVSHFPLLYQARYRAEWDSPNTFKYVNLSQTTHGDLTGLNPFTTYDICVRSHPVRPEGYWSDCPDQPVSVQTDKAAPVGAVPAWLHVTPSRDPGIRNVVIYWKELPPRDRNGVIKDYTVTVASTLKPGQISRDSYGPFTIPGNGRHRNLSELQLKSDTSYVIKVYASNEVGRSQDKILLLPQVGHVPTVSSPINISVTSPTSVRLSWQQPEEFRVQLTGYIVFWMAWKSENQIYTWGNPDWESITDDQALSVATVQHEISRGLRGRTRYRFGIATVSREGFGEAKVVEAYTEEMVPVGQVEDLTLTTAGPTSLTLTWEPLRLEWRGGILLGYLVQYCPLVEGAVCAEETVLTVNVTGEETASVLLQGLSPFTRYSVRIAAVNRVGSGQFSAASVQTTAAAAPEDPPTNVRFPNVTATVLRLMWDPPRIPNGIITYYMAQVNGEVHQLVDVDRVPVYGNTNYSVRLQACTSAGCGPFSSNHSVTTPIGDPEAPPPPTVSERKSSPSTVHLRLAPPAHPNGPIDHYLVSYTQKDSNGRTQTHVQTVEGTTEAVIEVDCAENKAVTYEFWVQAVNRDEQRGPLTGESSTRLERQMCLVPVVRVDGVPVAIVIPVVAGIISIILVTFLVWKNRHRVKRKLFPHVPGPVLFLEKDGPYSALYVVTPTSKHEPEICDDISDFLSKDGEVSLLTDGQESLNKNEGVNEARPSAPKTPLGSMSYVSRQEDSSPPSNGISRTPEHHSPTDSLKTMSLWDAEKTPRSKDQTKTLDTYIRVVPEGDEEFYCVTGTLLEKTTPNSDNMPYVTNLPSPLPNGANLDSNPNPDYCVTGTLHDSTSPGPVRQEVPPASDMPYITNITTPPPSGNSVDSKPEGEEHFGYQARYSKDSPCEEKEPLIGNQGAEGRYHGAEGHCPDNQESPKVNTDGYVRGSLPDGNYVPNMPGNASLTFAPYTPH